VRGHEENVASAALSPDGKRFFTASRDDTARLWDAETGRLEGARNFVQHWKVRAACSRHRVRESLGEGLPN
jgi:WD40 repeat protein